MSAPCYQKISEKEIFPGVTEFKSEYCNHFRWQICEENVLISVPTCEFGTRNNPTIKNTEVSGIPLRPPLKDTEPKIINRPDGCPIGIKDETELFVFTKGKLDELTATDKTRQVTLEVFG